MIKTGDILHAPAGNYIILIDPPPGKSDGGLIIPEVAQKEGSREGSFLSFARILAVGAPGLDRQGNPVSAEFAKGARIAIHPASTAVIPHPSRRLCLISFTAVLCEIVGNTPNLTQPTHDSECVIPNIINPVL
jgi:co-chaperonin GroES (HSP10)